MIDTLAEWWHKHWEEAIWLVAIGVVTIHIDVLLARIAASLDRLARELRDRAAGYYEEVREVEPSDEIDPDVFIAQEEGDR